MREHFPGYDVMRKRHTPSWNEITRRVIDQRLSLPGEPRFFTLAEWEMVQAICQRVVPQVPGRPPVPAVAMVDHRLHTNALDGYRNARLPPQREAWRRGLHALEQEAQTAYGRAFVRLAGTDQDVLLRRMQQGELRDAAWGEMPPALFFSQRLMHDIVHGHYAFPQTWNEIGFGGPASPRGYVRMGFDRRDSWEAVEAHGGNEEHVRDENRRVG
ncbi:MAG TPA: gluconate 2-dehydrogenase subunit 3 family protein [Acetobacteraceae bacterium]|nr:gluconate 2-dehydrogenase subunit 3 family protein [Acetobacteraceae bacterium]